MEENNIAPNPSMGNAMPKKSVNVWMIVAIIFILIIIGLGVYGFITIRNQNNKINSLNSQVSDLQNTKKTLEDAVAAAAKDVAQSTVSTQGTTDEALIAQAKNRILTQTDVKTVNATITEKKGDFAKISYNINSQNNASSMVFKKVNGTWQFIYAGQLNPCTDLIAIYGVPETWIDNTCSVTPKGAYTP
ncbi:hypothetical protein LBMAG34_0970 [Candidatus Saccharibacteria bacterium]|nr:hypothetical protein LBMAG34_0970 [Candidatus Saccharibacteria bacterium]